MFIGFIEEAIAIRKIRNEDDRKKIIKQLEER